MVRHHEGGGTGSNLESLKSCIQILTLPLLSQADKQSNHVIPMRGLISSAAKTQTEETCTYSRRRATHVGATSLSSELTEMGVQVGMR